MNRAGFMLARMLRREAPLAALSVPQREMLAELDGLSVALIGNARSMDASTQGDAIEAHDRVMRINAAPILSPRTHGSRTDWLFLAVRLSDPDRARLAPRRQLWMSHKRKRLQWQTATSPGFYLHPLADYRALAARLGAPPSTGAMAVDLLLRSKLARLDLYGFDGFASLSLSGRRTAAQVPHDFSAETAWMAALAGTDPRLAIHPPG